MTYSRKFIAEAGAIAAKLPDDQIEAMASELAAVRDGGGRLFILGVGGGAAHASHAVNDFRKICHFEAYTPVDNVAELTARTNDDGWETSFQAWLQTSRLSSRDALLVFSVGGGSREHGVSLNVVLALEHAHRVGARIYGVVGAPGGSTAALANICVLIAAPSERRTPHVESFQALVWHLLVSHPALARQPGKWESIIRNDA